MAVDGDKPTSLPLQLQLGKIPLLLLVSKYVDKDYYLSYRYEDGL